LPLNLLNLRDATLELFGLQDVGDAFPCRYPTV
jgi:hypothetical protein